ncbi:hypothetical protein MKX01_011716 [Papaver californicum]|nr:hypothetical protein MKX01_011716 [Papaver californicum]
MLFQVGGEGTRPTFFEMAAAQQFPASLRAALTYSLGVLAVRRPFLHKVLDYDDEFFALLMMILENHSLRTTDASFPESLYGVRRREANVEMIKDKPRLESGDEFHHSGLKKHQRVLSVAFLVHLYSAFNYLIVGLAILNSYFLLFLWCNEPMILLPQACYHLACLTSAFNLRYYFHKLVTI